MSGVKSDLAICKLCLEPITNPICISCLSLSVNEWIKKEGTDFFYEYSKKSFRLLDFVLESEEDPEYCVKCHDYNTKVICPFCYTHSVYDILKEINWIKAEKFKIVFNYGLGNAEFVKREQDEEVIHVKNFQPIESIKEREIIVDICDECGNASYKIQKIKGENKCEGCLV